MIGAYATVAVVCAASVAVGQAVLSACGRREFTWLSAPAGLAALLVLSGIAIKLPGHATAVAVAIPVVAGLALVWLWVSGGAVGFGRAAAIAVAPALVAVLGASLPFIASGRVGILGVGLVNDDMASHLVIADWIGSHAGPVPKLVEQGYPVGPHALVDGISSLLGSGLVETFAGLTLALPVLMAALAAGVLADLRPGRRTVAAALVALSYLGAAYLAQEAFKEPIEALLVLGFALALPSVRDGRSAIPLGVIAAGSVYAYSFPGLAWLGAAAMAYVVLAGLFRIGAKPAHMVRFAPIATCIAAGAVLLVLIAPEIPRIADFTGFRAFRSESISGGLGNLRHQLSPLEALGVWPTSEFRLAAADSSHPLLFYAGAIVSLAALCLGVPRWLQRRGPAVPAALAAAVVIYVGALLFGTVYTSAKALSIGAPLVMLISLGALFDGDRLRIALASALAVAAAASSFLVLREAPVGPADHHDELAALRPLVAGQRALFLGRDDFVRYDLAGARPYVAVRNFYDDLYVRPRLGLADVFRKFDFDSVSSRKLHGFPYVITTRGAFASGPPPWLRLVRTTPSFALWKRVGPLAPRRTLAEGPDPGALLRCSSSSGDRIASSRGTAAAFDHPPVASSEWTPGPTVTDGSPATGTLQLPRGRWELSLQYDASRDVRVTAPGFEATLPANLDYRGSTPYYGVPGEVAVTRERPVRVTVSVERPPLAGRLLGASSVAHLGAIAATRARPGEHGLPGNADVPLPLSRACGRYVDWYAPRG